ncbi:GNAT family N-acetyltransferase [Streptomyces sp. ZYX-F-203]
MEISTGGRLEVRITRADVGRRVSVRRLLTPHGTAHRFADAVGTLTSWDDGVLVITRKDGDIVQIPESALVAGKVVPPSPARRRGPVASFEELTRASAAAWPPVESERLGDWVLRASGGFTRRANSVLPLGDPGMPLDRALETARRWYAKRGLPPLLQTATGPEDSRESLGARLDRRGWVREGAAEVWVGAPAPIGDLAGGAGVALSREADDAWIARYGRVGESEAARSVLAGGSSVWFAAVPGPSAPRAIGRCVVEGRWAVFGAVEVDPAARRRGLATAVMAALAERALDEGASAACLQVETGNVAARALYAGMGFAPHHAYHHHRAPGPPGDSVPGRGDTA